MGPHTQAHLLIAGGQSTYSEKLQALIHTLPPQQQRQIVVLSNFEEAEKPNLLAACDIFVLPSGEESFGIAFIEAWACGKPVIGTRSGAIPTVIAEGQDGLIVKYGDADELAQAIQTLLQAPERRETLGNAGRKKVLENYTWEIVTDQLRTVYTKITGSKRLHRGDYSRPS
jgi:glycosyltransferase involved in cell wall biosynthesis